MKPWRDDEKYVQYVDEDCIAEDRVNGRVCRPNDCGVLLPHAQLFPKYIFYLIALLISWLFTY
jgi:hypothetical protein